VGQGVGQAVDPHFDSHHFQHFCNEKAPKAEVFDAFWTVLMKKMHAIQMPVSPKCKPMVAFAV